MKKFYTIVILLTLGITQTQIYAQCFNCDVNTKAFSIGTGVATGSNSFAGGYQSSATTDNSFVFGIESMVTGLRGIALGNLTKVSQTDGIAIGNNALSNALNSYVFGQNLNSKGENSITIGLGSSYTQPLENNKPGSIMFGVTNKPSLTIVQPPKADVGYLGIGTDAPEEMVHINEGNLLITSVNSGSTDTPSGALLFDNFSNSPWSIEYLTHGSTGLNFRKYAQLTLLGAPNSVLFLANNSG